MSNRHWLAIIQTSGARIYWVLATLITTVITTRYLGPSGRGTYVAAVSWVTAFSTFGYLSLSQVIVYLTAQKKDHAMSRIVGSMTALLAVICCIGWVTATILYLATNGSVYNGLDPLLLVISFLSLPFLLWIENGNGVLMAIERIGIMNLAQMAGATALMILTLLGLSLLRGGVPVAMAALVLSQAVVAATTFTAVHRHVGPLQVDKASAAELLKGGGRLHLNAIGVYLFGQANVLVLSGLASADETAFYQLAVQLITALQIIPLAVSTVSYSLVARHGVEDAWPAHRRLLLQLIALVILLAVIGYFVAPLVIPLLFGKAFAPAVPLFRIMLLGAVGMVLSIGMAPQWIGRGLFLESAILTLVFGAATVGANLFVVPRLGATGAAWVLAAAYSTSVLTNGAFWLYIERKQRARLRPEG